MNDNRNMLLAIVLSAFVLIGWSLLSDKLLPSAGPQTQQVEKGKVQPVPQPQADPAADSPQALRARDAVLVETPRLKIDTPQLQGSINLKGARFDDLVLLTQRETIAKDSPPVRLLSPAGAKDSYFAQFGWSGQGIATPDANSVWAASAPVLVPGQPVTLSWANPTGQRFELILSIDDGYMFTVRQRVVNGGSGAVGLRTYGLASRSAKSPDPSTWTSHVGPISYLADKADYDVDWETLDDNKAGVTRDSRGGWLGFTDKYWLTALIPAAGAPVEASFRKSASGAYQADFAGSQFIVAPGQAVASEVRLFAGAKEKTLLDRYENEGDHQAFQVDRLGLVRMVHAADLQPAQLAVRRAGQLRPRDHRPDLHRPPDPVPDRGQAIPVDGGDAQGPAENEGAPGTLQGRQAEAAAGDAEALQGGEDQSGCRLPSDPAANPDLLCALQGADGQRRNAPPAVLPVDQGPFARPTR